MYILNSKTLEVQLCICMHVYLYILKSLWPRKFTFQLALDIFGFGSLTEYFYSRAHEVIYEAQI